jgi:hypothetical protein
MSTGLNCNLYERKPGEWYYLLERWDSPKGGWDWREYATAYGPFGTEDEAYDHLRDNHANPGGSCVERYGTFQEDAVLTRAFAAAPENTRRHARTHRGPRGAFYFPDFGGR